MSKTETAFVTLAGEKVGIEPFTLDQLRVVLPKIGKLQSVRSDLDQFLGLVTEIIAEATGKTGAEIGAMKISLAEVSAALEVVVRVSGLEDLGKTKAAAN